MEGSGCPRRDRLPGVRCAASPPSLQPACPETACCREKYVKGRLAELEQRQRQQAGAGEGEHAGGQRGGDAEEADRELWMLQADLAALQVRTGRLGRLAAG